MYLDDVLHVVNLCIVTVATNGVQTLINSTWKYAQDKITLET